MTDGPIAVDTNPRFWNGAMWRVGSNIVVRFSDYTWPIEIIGFVGDKILAWHSAYVFVEWNDDLTMLNPNGSKRDR